MSIIDTLNHYDTQHVMRMLKSEQEIGLIFNEFAKSVSKELRRWNEHNLSNVWLRNSAVEKSIDKKLTNLASVLEDAITQKQEDAWTSANLKNDEIAAQFIQGMSLSSIVKDGMFKRNMDALKALQKRTYNGMNLSQRVWSITKQTKGNIELFLEGGIATGRSAEAIGRDLRQMLVNPDKRFRRVRNKQGKLVLSQPMKDYHPGAGVYRSSRMNALRVAATETNMGYRVADSKRWEQLGFVLGFEVNRTRNAKPCAICDALVGKYPTDFIFPGWHPFCLCFATPIVMDHKDFADYLLNGKIPQDKIIKDIPDSAKDWIKEHEEKGLKEPLFVKTNKDFLNKPIKQKRIKTDAEKADIQKRWNKRVSTNKHTEHLNEIKKIYGKESKSINTLINSIKKDIKAGKSINSVDALVKKLDHKVDIKIAWDERVEVNHLEKLLVDVKQLKEMYTINEIKTVYSAVENKLKQWESLPLEEQEKKLKFEIGWVEGNKKYNTWKIAQDAYKKELSSVQYQIGKKAIEGSISHSVDFSKTTKSGNVKKMASELNDLLKQHAPLDVLSQKASALNSKVADLEAAKAARIAKKITGNLKPVKWGDGSLYTKKRKDAAMWAKSAKDADEKLRDVCGAVWRSATAHQRLSSYRYTAGSSYINEPLRGQYYSGQYKNKYDSVKDANALSEIIDKSAYDFDMWLQRGVDANGFRGLFGIDITNLKDIKSLVGKIGTEKAFSSCGNSKASGFSSKQIIYNIYAPAGTKTLYAEPFSAFGHGAKKNWDGIAKQGTFGYEAEMILQKNTSFRIVKAEHSGGKLYLDLEIIEQ